MRGNALRYAVTTVAIGVIFLLATLLPGAVLASPDGDVTPYAEWSLEAEVALPDSDLPGVYDQVGFERMTKLVTRLKSRGALADFVPLPEGDSGSRYLLRASSRESLDDFRTVLYKVLRPALDVLGEVTAMTIMADSVRGDTVSLVLEARPSTGYRWIVAPDSAMTESAPAAFEMHTPGYGVRERQILRLLAGSGRDFSIKIAYQRPWEAAPATRHFTVKLSFMPERLDLSDPSSPAEPVSLPFRAAGSAEPPVSGAASLPSSWDWRTQGTVTPVRDQGSCGGCWSFGTVGVFESALWMSGTANVDLSEQYLISCNTHGWGCDGGLTAHMYHYNRLGKNQTLVGAVLEADKPYSATNGTCNQAYDHPHRLGSWAFITPSEFDMPTVDGIKNAIYAYGPITAGVCVGNAFQNYKSGIFSTNENCGGSTNHQIILVGWDDAGSYWILRNSWGSGWGLNGYMNIKYNTSRVGEGTSYVQVASTTGPTLLIDGGSSSTKAQGGTFTFTGANYTANGTVYRYVKKPGSSSWEQQSNVTATGSGNVSWPHVTSCADAVGTYYWYARDVGKGQDSAQVTEVITTNAGCGSSDTAMTSGVGYGGSVAQGQWKYFYIDVPAGATNLEIKITGLSADVDLYTLYNVKPTSSSYSCRPYAGGTAPETCTYSNPAAGRWWAGVYGYRSGSFTITATITAGTPTPTLLIDGGSSSTKAQGGTFTFTGANYTANGTVYRYVRKPGSSSWEQQSNVTATGSGNVSWPHVTSCADAVGTYYWYARDVGKGQDSAQVTQVITPSSGCSPPTSGITVTVPNGGESWRIGTRQTIRWTYTGNPGTSVKIELLKAGVVNATLTSSASIGSGGAGSYTWTIPTRQATGSDYRIRVTSTTDGTKTDTSDGNFSITR